MTQTSLFFVLTLTVIATVALNQVEAQATQSPHNEIQSLFAKVQQDSQIPVIVGLYVEYDLKGELAESNMDEIQSQRARINTVQDALLSKLESSGFDSASLASNHHKYKYIPYISMTVNEITLNHIVNSPLISSVTEDVPISYALSQSIPLINADRMWNLGHTGAGQTIAVLDTGIEKNHPFLSGKIVSEACYSTTNSIHSSTTLCPNGQSEDTSSDSAHPCDDLCDHGTHVAGIAAGKSPNFSGVAKDADIIAVQIFSKFDNPSICSSNPCVLTYTSDQMKGLERVYELRDDYDISSVNMSIGGGSSSSSCDSDPRKAIIDQLRSVGIATVISSGNNGYTDSLSYPACISSAISVGSVDDGSGGTNVDAVSSFSNSAHFLDLLAPGKWITSSVPGVGYDAKQGTSMAAPHAAGAWAVLASENPQASVEDILNSLVTDGVIITDTRNGLQFSRIQLDMESSGCIPPSSGDWIVSEDCTISSDVTVNSASLIVQNNSLLTIENNASLDVDLVNHFINVESGSGILIKQGSKIH